MFRRCVYYEEIISKGVIKIKKLDILNGSYTIKSGNKNLSVSTYRNNKLINLSVYNIIDNNDKSIDITFYENELNTKKDITLFGFAPYLLTSKMSLDNNGILQSILTESTFNGKKSIQKATINSTKNGFIVEGSNLPQYYKGEIINGLLVKNLEFNVSNKYAVKLALDNISGKFNGESRIYNNEVVNSLLYRDVFRLFYQENTLSNYTANITKEYYTYKEV